MFCSLDKRKSFCYHVLTEPRCAKSLMGVREMEIQMAQNVKVNAAQPGEECMVDVAQQGDDLHITVHGNNKVTGVATYKRDKETKEKTDELTGNRTIATSHGFVLLGNGQELTFSLIKRGAGRKGGTVRVS